MKEAKEAVKKTATKKSSVNKKKETASKPKKATVAVKKTTKTTTSPKTTVKKETLKEVKVTKKEEVVIEATKEKTVKKHNLLLSFWTCFLAIMFVGYSISALTQKGQNGYWLSSTNWWSQANMLLFMFALIAGYALVNDFKKRNSRKESPTARALEYLGKIAKKALPILAIGYGLGLIISKFYFGYEFGETINITINGLWEFIGLHAAGFRGSTSLMVGNEALWFISSILICSYFLYWLMARDEEKAKGFIVPFIFLLIGGIWCKANSSGLTSGLLFTLVGMSGGIIIYYLVEKLKTHKFTSEETAFLTFIYVVIAGLLIWFTLYPTTSFALDPWTVYLFSGIIVMLTFLGSDLVVKFVKNEAIYKVSAFLSEASIYLYMIHYPVILLVLLIAGKNNPGTIYSAAQIFWPTLILSYVLSSLIKLFYESVNTTKKND